MVSHKLVLPSGAELTNSQIMSVSFATSTVDGQDVRPGSVNIMELEVKLWSAGGALEIAQGSQLQFYTVAEDGVETQIGNFRAEKPIRSSKNTYTVTAYDNASKLEVDLTDWLDAQTWPMSLQDLVEAVCAKCGVTLANSFINFGDTSIPQVAGDSVTGRQILGWAAEIGGYFVRATPQGLIEFAWYVENNACIINPDTDTPGNYKYKSGSLTYPDYTVATVDKIQFRQSDEDVGVIYPPALGEANTLVISGNGVTAGLSAATLDPMAQALYDLMHVITYVPFTAEIAYTENLRAGDIISVRDANGVTFTAYVTGLSYSGGSLTVESVGNPTRDSVSAVGAQKFRNLQGKVMDLDISIDGLKIANSDMQGRFAELSMTVEGLETDVGNAQGDITQLQQTAGTVSVRASREQGTLETIISNDGTWRTQFTDMNGRVLSGMYFDFESGQFQFDGSGSFSGELRVGGTSELPNFLVDVNGNVTARGDTTIYGGKFYAMDQYGIGGWTEQDVEGFGIYDSDGVERLKLGFPVGSLQNPFIVLNGGTTETAARNIIKQFSNGLWLGNYNPASRSGAFYPQTGDVGMFISLEDQAVYVVSGTSMAQVFTGEAIARFG